MYDIPVWLFQVLGKICFRADARNCEGDSDGFLALPAFDGLRSSFSTVVLTACTVNEPYHGNLWTSWTISRAQESATVNFPITMMTVLENATTATVEGVGRIAFRLCKEQAASSKSVCKVAPFGKGSETVVDQTVLKAWKFSPEKLMTLEQWDTPVQQLVSTTIASKLGLCDDDGQPRMNIRPNLYKLVFYEGGGFFVTHRDSEKESGMFGTLVIQLPAEHTGDMLEVRHKGKTHQFDFDQQRCTGDLLPVCAAFLGLFS